MYYSLGNFCLRPIFPLYLFRTSDKAHFDELINNSLYICSTLGRETILEVYSNLNVMFSLVTFDVFVILFRYFMDSNSLSLSPVSFNYVYETCSGKLIELIELRSVAIPVFDRLFKEINRR